MGSRSGYEWEYKIWMDEELLSLYKQELASCGRGEWWSYVVEVRTVFKLKELGGTDNTLATEKFTSYLPVSRPEERLREKTRYRLLEYGMSEAEIRSLVRVAYDFVQQIAADPQYADLHVIPVVVDLNVRTVQLDGEPLHATEERSIQPDCLIPFHVWLMSSIRTKECESLDHKLRIFLLDMPRIRVENVEKGRALMEACTICLRGPRVGAQLSTLPDCNHTFHNHCVIRWLLKSKSCPLCHSQVHIKKWPYENPKKWIV